MGTEHKLMIQLDSVTKVFKNRERSLEVLSQISFDVAEKEFVCIVGPSGCGKTTLLNLMGGFTSATGGQVLIEGKPVSKPSPRYLTIFQDYKLLPWRTVRKNIELGFEGIKPKLSRKEIDLRVDAQIETVGLTGFEDFRPTEISGGMNQRVAIARALVLEPRILFMDEPFGALDALTREDMKSYLRRLLKKSGQTVVMVTHNISEAIYFADRIIIMHSLPGRISAILDVVLPEDRDVYTPEFTAMRDRVYSYLA